MTSCLDPSIRYTRTCSIDLSIVFLENSNSRGLRISAKMNGRRTYHCSQQHFSDIHDSAITAHTQHQKKNHSIQHPPRQQRRYCTMAAFSSGDAVNAIVGDIGQYATKLGFAGEDYPRSYFRSVRPYHAVLGGIT